MITAEEAKNQTVSAIKLSISNEILVATREGETSINISIATPNSIIKSLGNKGYKLKALTGLLGFRYFKLSWK